MQWHPFVDGYPVHLNWTSKDAGERIHNIRVMKKLKNSTQHPTNSQLTLCTNKTLRTSKSYNVSFQDFIYKKNLLLFNYPDVTSCFLCVILGNSFTIELKYY